jgi:8-oxo-dGTP pyrophosphatase MutT (NUDIX family)
VVEPPASWQERLPRRVVASGALIRDHQGRVLLVEPTYKPNWEIPGGLVEGGESAPAACARELHEELGLRLPVGRLLCLDWASPAPGSGRGAGLRCVYDGGSLPEGAVVRLPVVELASWRYVGLEGLDALCSPALARRVRAAVAAAERGEVAELEDGVPRVQGEG